MWGSVLLGPNSNYLLSVLLPLSLPTRLLPIGPVSSHWACELGQGGCLNQRRGSDRATLTTACSLPGVGRAAGRGAKESTTAVPHASLHLTHGHTSPLRFSCTRRAVVSALWFAHMTLAVEWVKLRAGWEGAHFCATAAPEWFELSTETRTEQERKSMDT